MINNINGLCKKCGYSTASIIYHKKYQCWKNNDEHIHRNCNQCGYDWVEECLDKRYVKKEKSV